MALNRQRLKDRRLSLDLTLEEVAEEIGVKKPTVQRYESGKIKTISTVVIEKLAEALHTTPSYLMGWTDDPYDYSKDEDNRLNLIPTDIFHHLMETYKDDAAAVWKAYQAMSEDSRREQCTNIVIPDQSKIRSIPVYETVAAGFGAYASSQVISYMPIFIQSDEEAAETLCITVEGDSMSPKIENGDTVVVRKQSSIESGQIAVVLIDGEDGVVKKVVYGSDWVELHSINPYYPPRRFEGAEVQRLQIVGLVRKIVKEC